MEDTKKLLLVSSRSWSTTNTSDGFPFHETGTRWWRRLVWWNEAVDEAAEPRTGVLLALPLALPLGAVAGHPSHGPAQHTQGRRRRRRLWRRCSVRRDGWRWRMQVVCLSLIVQPPQLVRSSMQQDTSKKKKTFVSWGRTRTRQSRRRKAQNIIKQVGRAPHV